MSRSIDCVPAKVMLLSGHQICRASVCIGCMSKVLWNKKPRYLPQEGSLVKAINKRLPDGINLDVSDIAVPSSICANCVINLQRKETEPRSQRFAQALSNRVTNGESRSNICRTAKTDMSNKFRKSLSPVQECPFEIPVAITQPTVLNEITNDIPAEQFAAAT